MIGAEGAETPAGLAEQVRPRRRSRGGSPPPAESEHPGAEITPLFHSNKVYENSQRIKGPFKAAPLGNAVNMNFF
ncbi:hypothetical protein BIV59_08470 [Bacillus sp. MUM 13]|nr:hypothetical protein BIV59_08470 [Bacillus sp. MUM 13]